MSATLFPWILAGTRQHFEVVADMHHIADRSVEPQWSKRIDERSDGPFGLQKKCLKVLWSGHQPDGHARDDAEI